MAKKKNELQKNVYEMQAEICGALANPVRLHILDLLSNGERSVSELIDILQIPKANLSQHLTVLRDSGIISSRKEGLFQFVSLAIPKIKEACQLVRSVLVSKIESEEKQNHVLIRELKSQRLS